MRPGATIRWACLCCALLAAAGCGVRNPWKYNTPPTALGEAEPRGMMPAGDRVVVVGRFENPARSPLRWRDIGPGVSEALSTALLNEGGFDVWSNQRLADAVDDVLRGPTAERRDRLEALHRQHEDVRFVITGHVTDFHYTNEVSSELRRRGIFGQRDEAIVAIQFNVVDLKDRRLIVSDHVHGTAKVGSGSSRDVYADIAFGSYLFWNSPLGRATENSIRSAMARIRQVVPAATGEGIRIVEQITLREVRVTAVTLEGLRVGQEYFVCRFDEAQARLVPITDPLLGRPLRARISSIGRDDGTAWLLGEPPPRLVLRGAELCLELPPIPVEPPAPATAAVGEEVEAPRPQGFAEAPKGSD